MGKRVGFGSDKTGVRALGVVLLLGGAAFISLSSVARDSAPQSKPIVTLDAATASAARPQQGKYPPQMVVPGQAAFDGSFRETVVFKGVDGQHSVRIWESGPGALQTDGYPHDEYCLVLEGKLEITNRSGSAASYGPGDTFVIPKGWQGVWNMKTKFRKQYIVLTAVGAEG